MSILVTGGAGYIGSHTVQRLLRDGRSVVVLDNLFRGHRRPMDLLAQAHPGRLKFIQGDVGDAPLLARLFREHAPDTVMHFAAMAYVGESVDHPLDYYRCNVSALETLLRAGADAPTPVSRFVFSSSCSTYGQPDANHIPVREDCPQAPVSPYGRTKLIGEMILRDFGARPGAGDWACTMLRYFNVCGCDRAGLLGEDHTPETHLVPVVLEAALGRRPHIGIFGTDYPTPDGTCIRDYVHVEDLADAHVRALDAMRPRETRAYNVGIGRGYSVREIIDAARRVTGRDIRVVEQPRRPGDPPVVFNDPTKITAELGWKAELTDLDEIIATAWRWMLAHPKGYAP